MRKPWCNMKLLFKPMPNFKKAILYKELVGILCLLFYLVSFCQMPAVGRAADASRRHVRVGYYIVKGFQEYDPQTGIYSGSGFEYLMALKQYTNWELELIPVEFMDGVAMLERGELDLLNNVAKTPSRERTLGFSAYASGSNYGVLAVDANNTSYADSDFASFHNMRIGGRANSAFQPYFEEFCRQYNLKPKSVKYYKTIVELNAALKKGEIDARIVSSSYHDNSRIVAKFAPMEYYFAVPKGNTELLKELNLAMESLRTYLPHIQHQLEQKYANEYYEKNVVLSGKEKMFLRKNGPIKVAVDNEWLPIARYTKQGQYQGVLANIFAQLSQRTGLVFQFIPYDSYVKSLEAVNNGDVAMIAYCPYDFVFANKWHLALSEKLQEGNVYRVLNETTNSSRVRSVGMYGNLYLEDRVKHYHGGNVTFKSYASATAAMEAVLKGNVDCVYMDQYVATQFQNKGKYLGLKYIIATPLKFSFCLGISDRHDPLLKSIIGKGLRNIPEDYINNLFQQVEEGSGSDDLEIQLHRNPGLVIIFLMIIIVSIVFLLGAWFYTKRMRTKNKELEQARMAQTEFLSRMSHDMRTPMNGILGLSFLMEREQVLEKIKGYLPQLQESSKYLLQLINDVLDVNKISGGHMSLNPRVCDEQVVFKSIIDMIEPQMAAKDIQFNFIKTNIDWKYMYLDEQRVKQVFMNLLNNAVKFTPQGGQVDFYMELVSETETMIRDKFVIKDNGIGIGKDFMPHVFEPFQQEHDDTTDYANGTGLGLAIVQKLVELMGGNIQVESEKGKGATFTLYLNFPLVPPAECVALEKKKHVVAGGVVLREGLRILLCEDHPLNATIATKLLEKEKALVTWAKNGQEGVELFAQAPVGTFDLILMDIRMPVMNGLDSARTIRNMARQDAKTIPIIAMSANAYPEDVEKSLEAGMNAHLAKPVEPEKLYTVINDFVRV